MSGEELRIRQMVDDIIENAKEEAKVILSEVKRQVVEVEQKGENRAEREKLSILETELKMIKEQEKQQIASLNLQARREILQKKEEAITTAFDSAKKALEQFSKKDAYIKVLEQLIVEAGTALDGGNLVIKTRKEDKAKVKDLTTIAKAITKATGNKSSLKISKEPINTIGGVVLQTEDETITIDNTFEARLDQKYRTIRTEVAKKLFEQEKK